MSAPDVSVAIAESRGKRLAPPSTATWMIAAQMQRGPANIPVLTRSIAEVRAYFGARGEGDVPGIGFAHDALETFFEEGGSYAYVSRRVPEDAVVASKILEDEDEVTAITIRATSAGTWGNDVSVKFPAIGEGFGLQVYYDGVLVEERATPSSIFDIAEWAEAASSYVRIEVGEGETADVLPAGDFQELALGADGTTSDADAEAALDAYDNTYGPGQVSVPGDLDPEVQAKVLAHVASHPGRIHKLDSPDELAVADVAPPAIALRTEDGHRAGGTFWPWDVIPGPTSSSTRLVPPCARNAALHARELAEGFTVGDPAAGERFPARFVIGLSQPEPSDADRAALDDAGVNVSIVRDQIYTWGNRTTTNPIAEEKWAQLSQVTVIAAIQAGAYAIGRKYVHTKVRGKGFAAGELAGELEAMCLELYRDGDLHGDSPSDAFTITPAEDIDGPSATLLATIEARVSPGADRVEIEIYKADLA